jgi:hypothetical protein
MLKNGFWQGSWDFLVAVISRPAPPVLYPVGTGNSLYRERSGQSAKLFPQIYLVLMCHTSTPSVHLHGLSRGTTFIFYFYVLNRSCFLDCSFTYWFLVVLRFSVLSFTSWIFKYFVILQKANFVSVLHFNAVPAAFLRGRYSGS